MLTEITLPNDTIPVTLEDCPKYGVFDIYIRPKNDINSDRSYNRFHIGRSDNDINGQVVRMISLRGIANSRLDMEWPANAKPTIFYRPAPVDSSEPITYTVTIISEQSLVRLEEIEKRLEEQQKIIESFEDIKDRFNLIEFWITKNEENQIKKL